MSAGASRRAGVLATPDRLLAEGLRWGSVVSLILLWALISAGVLVRFLPFASMAWADEIVELAFAWMVFLGVAALWRDRSHFCVDLVLLKLGDSGAGRGLRVLLTLLCLAFLLVFTYEGVVLTLRATDRSPTLEYPKSLFYAVMPIAGAIMAAYSIRDLWGAVHGAAGRSRS